MAGKPKRLSKVTKEFNLGLSTVVDFLQDKGFEVDNNPNAKISSEMYDVLSGEFQTEKKVKEKSNKIEVKKPIKETVSIEEEKPKQEKTLEVINPEEKVHGKDSVKAELIKGEIENPLKENLTREDPVKEDSPKDDPGKKVSVKENSVKEDSSMEESVKERISKEKSELKVLGKIDLVDSKKPKSSVPRKKTEVVKKDASADKSESKKNIISQKEKNSSTESKVQINKQEGKTDKVSSPKGEVNEDFIKIKTEKLDGPKVLGKIELPVEKPKKRSQR
jgi:translation initiation factor IF-2